MSVSEKNIRTFATKRMKQFMWIAMSTMVLFFMISIQFNEGAIGELETTLLFHMCFYTLFMVFILYVFYYI